MRVGVRVTTVVPMMVGSGMTDLTNPIIGCIPVSKGVFPGTIQEYYDFITAVRGINHFSDHGKIGTFFVHVVADQTTVNMVILRANDRRGKDGHDESQQKDT